MSTRSAPVETPPLVAASEDLLNGLVAKHPLGCLGRPEEIANVSTFILSDQAGFMTWSYLLVDRGYTAV